MAVGFPSRRNNLKWVGALKEWIQVHQGDNIDTHRYSRGRDLDVLEFLESLMSTDWSSKF